MVDFKSVFPIETLWATLKKQRLMEMDLELFHLNQIKEINDEFGEDEKDMKN